MALITIIIMAMITVIMIGIATVTRVGMVIAMEEEDRRSLLDILLEETTWSVTTLVAVDSGAKGSQHSARPAGPGMKVGLEANVSMVGMVGMVAW